MAAQKIARKIVIVNEGEWGALRQSEGDYDNFVETLKDLVERSARKNEMFEEIFEAEVVRSLDEALVKVASSDQVDCLFFVTRGVLAKARRALEGLKSSRHHVPQMILFTGLLPDEEVVLIRKLWITSDLIHDLVRG